MQTRAPPTDQYLTWQDLLEPDAATCDAPWCASDAPAGESPLSGADAADGLPKDVALPPDIQALLAEKERLEDELKRLTGAGTPRPEDERIKRMYPVRVHTVETRIEDRRLRKHDEHLRLLKQRTQEARLLRAREQARQADLAAERRRRAIERALARVREQLRRAEAEADHKRRVRENARARARVAEREKERRAAHEREELLKQLTEARWAAGRRHVLHARAIERCQDRNCEEWSLDSTRTSHKRLAGERRAQQQHTRQQRRVEETHREPSSRVQGGQEHDKKHEWLDWEQKQESVRERALQRRREGLALMRRLDERGRRADMSFDTA